MGLLSRTYVRLYGKRTVGVLSRTYVRLTTFDIMLRADGDFKSINGRYVLPQPCFEIEIVLFWDALFFW